MDAISTDDADLRYSDLPPMLLAASGDRAMARAERSAIAAGFRVGARMPIESAGQLIEQQVSATALWVELDSDGGGPMDELLAQVSRDVGNGRYAAVISATADLLDPLAASLETSGVELIIDADDAERAAALAIATTVRGMPLHVSDVASDNNAERLRQLSEEVSRIASTLARLSTGPGVPARALEPMPAGDVPPPVRADGARGHPCPSRARSLRGDVRRSGLGHAARPAAGGNRAASRARVEPVHRCRGAGDDRAAVAQDDG
jgi:hypothetical protein